MNPLPKLSDTKWFSLDERQDDDALLIQEEDEYKYMVQWFECRVSLIDLVVVPTPGWKRGVHKTMYKAMKCLMLSLGDTAFSKRFC